MKVRWMLACDRLELVGGSHDLYGVSESFYYPEFPANVRIEVVVGLSVEKPGNYAHQFRVRYGQKQLDKSAETHAIPLGAAVVSRRLAFAVSAPTSVAVDFVVDGDVVGTTEVRITNLPPKRHHELDA